MPADDTSVRFVQTHSAQREVEVLHDRLLAWLDADPTLKPADIMVMVPDMANFAPHIHAVFGRFASHDPRHLPYTVADTTPRTEPLVQALDTLLQLPQLRVTRVEWQSLFEVAAVRKRFGLEEHDVAQLDTWLADAGVRWGLDAPHRKPWGIAPDMADANQNSWLFGVERLLLGYAVGSTAESLATPWADTLPQAGVGGLDARVVEGLLQWLRHTQIALLKLRQDHTPTEWPEDVADANARGWEFFSHGIYNTRYAYDMSEEQERAIIEDSIATVREATGQTIRGWLAPALTHTPRTLT